MSRRHSAEKREIFPDERYGSIVVTRIINKVMKEGKKSIAQRIVLDALADFAKKANVQDRVIEALEQALENAQPKVEVKSKRIGGATYQVPMEIVPERRLSYALAWVVQNSRKKAGKSMAVALATELYDCLNNQGTTIKKRDEVHKMAEANKAFAHFGKSFS